MLVCDEKSSAEAPRAREPNLLWRIEPGKEETFEYMQGWLLRRQKRGADGYAMPSGQRREIPAWPASVAPLPSGLAYRRSPSVANHARRVGRTLLTAGDRMLQWARRTRSTM